MEKKKKKKNTVSRALPQKDNNLANREINMQKSKTDSVHLSDP